MEAYVMALRRRGGASLCGGEDMPTNIDRKQVQKLLETGAQLIDVLPAKAYEDEHLPGAINIPLTQLEERDVAGLRREMPVVVYCHDVQ